MTTYNWYFSQAGNDTTGSGTEGSPWKSTNKLNDELDANMAAGAIFNAFFNRGDTWSVGEPIGQNGGSGVGWAGTNELNIDAYGSGVSPIFDDYARGLMLLDIFDPNLDLITLKNFDSNGQYVDNNGATIQIRDVNNIYADNVNFDGHATGSGTYNNGDGGFRIRSGSGIIEIKNCAFENLGPNTMPADGVGETYGVEIKLRLAGSWSMHDCVGHDINADSIQIVASVAPGALYRNTFYNNGENAVDIKQSSNIDVYENDFYREAGFTGHGGVGGSGWALINIIPSIQQPTYSGESNNNKIYNNYLHDNAGSHSIYVGSLDNGYKCIGNKIYRNLIKNTAYGIYYGTSAKDTLLYNNVIIDSTSSGFYENNTQTGNVIYNNTFMNNAGMGEILNLFSSSTFKNNIFYQTDSADLILNDIGGSQTFENNLYYNAAAGDQNIILFNGTTYTEAQQASWRTAGHTGALFADPIFTNPSGSDLTLQSTSPCIDAGVDLGVDYDDALNPTSTWPDGVTTLDQDNYGAGWEIGAYVYEGASPYTRFRGINRPKPRFNQTGGRFR